MAVSLSAETYDVIIVGGGISGLYTAWRLAISTNLKIQVLEATERFGGRFLTCEMPGGFAADLGAMRYVPTCQPVLHSLIKHFGIKTQPWLQTDAGSNKFKFFIRNKQIANTEEFCRLLSITDEDLLHLGAARHMYFPSVARKCVIKGEDGNFETAIYPPTGQLARDVTLAQYLLQTNNVELLNSSPLFYPPTNYPISVVEGQAELFKKHWGSVQVIQNGFEAIVKSLIDALEGCTNVKIRCRQRVSSITQDGDGFIVKLMDEGTTKYLCNKVILACSMVGLNSILLDEQPKRQALLKEMTNKVSTAPALKVFLTYKRSWWEDAGIVEGSVQTDIPIQQCLFFGRQGKSDSFATALAAYSHKDNELFQSLDQEKNERFTNMAGDISSELVPSKLLVQFVHDNLKQIMGFPELNEEPVCAVRMFWGTGNYAGVWYYPKCGVNSNQLHWDSLKPFHDAEIYISGDTFTAWEPKGINRGFSEMALLTCERVLTNHFDLQPFVDDVCLQNSWSLK